MTGQPRIRWLGLLVPAMALVGCEDVCDSAPPRIDCCDHGCGDDVIKLPICDESGWHCPPGSVSRDQCPGPRFCMGPLPGPLPDAGQ